MAFTSGSATDYKDLLDKLRAYLVAQGWTVNRWTNPAGLTTISELAVVGPGSAGGQPVNVSIQTAFDTTTNAYSWKVCGHQTFDAARDFGLHPFNGPQHYFNLWPNAIDYRFYVNNRRFIVIAKIGVVYLSMYAGFFLPFCLPTEYPYPFYIGATGSYGAPYTNLNGDLRSAFDPGANAASYLRRDGMTWGTFANSNAVANSNDAYWSADKYTWPNRVGRADDNDTNQDYSHGYLQMLRPNVGGKLPLWQIMLVDHSDRFLAGMLDGVFATGGFNRVAEQVITNGATNYRLFINVGRTRPKDYFAVEEA